MVVTQTLEVDVYIGSVVGSHGAALNCSAFLLAPPADRSMKSMCPLKRVAIQSLLLLLCLSIMGIRTLSLPFALLVTPGPRHATISASQPDVSFGGRSLLVGKRVFDGGSVSRRGTAGARSAGDGFASS